MISDDPVEVYLGEIARVPVLTADEERALWALVAQGNGAAEKRLLEANLAMVVEIARRFEASSGKHVLDLIQEGNEGLLDAVRTFPGRSDVSFSRHAEQCVEAVIQKFVSK